MSPLTQLDEVFELWVRKAGVNLNAVEGVAVFEGTDSEMDGEPLLLAFTLNSRRVNLRSQTSYVDFWALRLRDLTFNGI